MCFCMVLDVIQLWLAHCTRRLERQGFTAMSGCGAMERIALHLVLATVAGAKDSWAVVTDEPPSAGWQK